EEGITGEKKSYAILVSWFHHHNHCSETTRGILVKARVSYWTRRPGYFTAALVWCLWSRAGLQHAQYARLSTVRHTWDRHVENTRGLSEFWIKTTAGARGI
ncbi:unnamed protein product, partial [Pylaiella littoralis]